MKKFASFLYKCAEPIILWQYLIGQSFVRYTEIKKMFGGNYPAEVFTIFDGFNQNTTRAGILARLRDIKFRHDHNANFAQAAMLEERLGRKVFGYRSFSL